MRTPETPCPSPPPASMKLWTSRCQIKNKHASSKEFRFGAKPRIASIRQSRTTYPHRPDGGDIPHHFLANPLQRVRPRHIEGEACALPRAHGVFFHLFFPDGYFRLKQDDPLVPRPVDFSDSAARARRHLRRLHHQHPTRTGGAGALFSPQVPDPARRDHQHRRHAHPV